MTPTTYTILFCASLTGTYLAVRAGWLRITTALFVGAVVNSAFFFLYAVSRGSEMSHATLFGVVFGLGFTVLSTGLGSMFRSYAAMPAPAIETSQSVEVLSA